MRWSFCQRVQGSAREVAGFVDQCFLHGLQSIEHNYRPVSNIEGKDIPIEFGKLEEKAQDI